MVKRSWICCVTTWWLLFSTTVLVQSSGLPREVDLLLTGGTVVTVDSLGRVISDGAVAIDGSVIVSVGSSAEVASAVNAIEIVDTSGQIVMPGLVNTHTHAPMVMFRGLADDLALMEWLEQYIFPAEAKTVTPEFVRVGTALAALEMIRSGTTTFVDSYYFEEVIAEVVAESGLRAVLGQAVIGFPSPDAAAPDEALTRAEAFIQAWRGHELINPAVAPHAMYTLDESALMAARNLALRYEVPILIHLAETENELNMAREQ